jgi:signal transduction histidine kinase
MWRLIRFKTSWLYHPVTIFLSMQVLWILLLILWIRWYLEKHAQLRQLANQVRAQAEVERLGWLPLVEAAVLMALILAGATVIFIYWKKQSKLNLMQRAFVSNVTHELKSPLASIQLALETMKMRDLSDAQRREYLGMMLEDTERLSGLIHKILGAARIEKTQSRYRPEPLSMGRFLEEVLEQDRRLFEKDGHKVVLEREGDAWSAVDRAAMQIVVNNLVENATRCSPRGSTIRVRLRRDLRSCRLDVIDTGEGIPRKDLKNVFKMFWRSEEGQRRTRGTGLGLYIVKNIVREHKGKVWAWSAGPGRGSTFSVRLPRVPRKTLTKTEPAAVEGQTS